MLMNIQMALLVNSRDIDLQVHQYEITVTNWHCPCNVPQLTCRHAGRPVPTDRVVCATDCRGTCIRQTERRGRFICVQTYL